MNGRIIQSDVLWWDEIAGPYRFASDVKTALTEGRSVALGITSAFPFRWTFRGDMEHWLGDNGVSCVQIDCARDYNGEDVGEFLIRTTGQERQHLANYLRQKQPRYLREKGVLNQKLIWLKSIHGDHLRSWIRFIADYRSTSFEQGVFVVEVVDMEAAGLRLPQHMSCIRYDRYVGEDDLRLFISMLAGNRLSQTPPVRRYIVELVASLCVTDCEIAERLLDCPELADSPVACMRSLYESWYGSDVRGRGMPEHPFELLHGNGDAVLTHRVWSAQVRIGYPLIELERRRLIEKWHYHIAQALDTPYQDYSDADPHYFVDYEKKRISNPYELEIGQLARMNTLRRYDDTSRVLLYFPHDDFERVQLLRDCRNLLAHLEICPFESFSRLLDE